MDPTVASLVSAVASLVHAIGVVDDVADAALTLARWSFSAAITALILALVALARTDRSRPTC
jgi:hypothetical protein